MRRTSEAPPKGAGNSAFRIDPFGASIVRGGNTGIHAQRGIEKGFEHHEARRGHRGRACIRGSFHLPEVPAEITVDAVFAHFEAK